MSVLTHPKPIEYDFVVVGGGSAGFAAARTAVSLGLTTLVIEGGEEVGGLCILRGCMPSKSVIESANRMMTLRRAAEFGLRAENVRAVGPEILARKRNLVTEFAEYRKGQLEAGAFDFLRGLVRFEDAHTLAVTSRDDLPLGTVRAKTFLISTGSRVSRVDVPGLAEVGYLTSDQALELDELPKSTIILGGGAIALEAAHHFSALGSEVTVVNRGPHLLRQMDLDVTTTVQHALARRGLKFCLGTKLIDAGRAPNGKKRIRYADAAGEHSIEADEILFALGREPAVEGLGLDCVEGLARNARGGLTVGTDQNAGLPHLFAAGDVVGPYEIVHLAVEQGEVAARNAARHLGKISSPAEQMDYRLKVFCLFTHPQVGAVGLTEREAADQKLEVLVASYPFAEHGKSMLMGETDGFVKLIAEKSTGRLVGAAVVGPDASELIHEIVVAMHFKGTARDMCEVPHYHPTLSEIWTYPAEELALLHPGGVLNHPR
jgi:pyruvate/2-oxoglutarate dehydrogenase complex dihydrolipoamide dehydrogenase (E3) component